jgi:membrane dipeptidase
VELIGVMLAHGYPDSAVEDILGRNYLRVCSQVGR